jgi:hypothetical protein
LLALIHAERQLLSAVNLFESDLLQFADEDTLRQSTG